jgi:hypothetical protein
MAEAMAEVMAKVTAEATAEAMPKAMAEVMAEATAEVTAEVTAEGTAEGMDKAIVKATAKAMARRSPAILHATAAVAHCNRTTIAVPIALPSCRHCPLLPPPIIAIVMPNITIVPSSGRPLHRCHHCPSR